MHNWKRILITGGSGMLAQELLPHIPENVEIIIPTRKPDTTITAHPGIKILVGSLFDEHFVTNITKNIDAVFHLASSRQNVQMHYNEAERIATENIVMTQNIQKSLLKHNRNPDIIFFSSALASEKNRTYRQKDGYVLGKIHCENLWLNFAKNTGNALLILRPPNIYGPSEKLIPDGNVIPALTWKALHAKNELHIWGSGKQKRCFAFAPDVAKACMTLLHQQYTGIASIGEPESISIAELALLITSQLHINLPFTFQPNEEEGGLSFVLDEPPAVLSGCWTPLSHGLKITYDKWRKRYPSLFLINPPV